MTRYEYIVKGGKKEMAKVIGLWLTNTYETELGVKLSCEELKGCVKTAAKKIEPWLDEEIEE